MIELPFNLFLKVGIRPDGSGDWIPVWLVQLPDSQVQLEEDDGVAIISNIQPDTIRIEDGFLHFVAGKRHYKWQARKAINVKA